MDAIYQRTSLLIGEENIEKLKNSSVLIAGLGGVGGFVFESLARCGIGKIGLLDFDVIDETNLNRQILALRSTVGKKKTEVAKSRLLDINPKCNFRVFDFKLNPDNIDSLCLNDWSYVADCIDDVPAKIALLKACKSAGVKIISSMGTGNKLNSDEFEICDINQTEYDRLARSIRKKTREESLKFDVIFSKESPVQDFIDTVPSISYMPAAAGLRISEFIIKNLIEIDM